MGLSGPVKGVMSGAIRERGHSHCQNCSPRQDRSQEEISQPIIFSHLLPEPDICQIQPGARNHGNPVMPWAQSRMEKGGVEWEIPRQWASDPKKANGMECSQLLESGS